MNVILHGEGNLKTMHLTDTESFQHKIIVRVKEFIETSNKWMMPITTDRDLVYRFTYHDGTHYHYQLEE